MILLDSGSGLLSVAPRFFRSPSPVNLNDRRGFLGQLGRIAAAGAVGVNLAFPGVVRADEMPTSGIMSTSTYGNRLLALQKNNPAEGWFQIYDPRRTTVSYSPYTGKEKVLFGDISVIKSDRDQVYNLVRADLERHYRNILPKPANYDNEAQILTDKITLYSALAGLNPLNFEHEGYCSSDGVISSRNLAPDRDNYLESMVKALNADVGINNLPKLGTEAFTEFISTSGKEGRLNKFFNVTLAQITDNGNAIPELNEVFNVDKKTPTPERLEHGNKSTLADGKHPPLKMVDVAMLLIQYDLSYDPEQGKLVQNGNKSGYLPELIKNVKPADKTKPMSVQVMEAIDNQFGVRKMRGVSEGEFHAWDVLRIYSYWAWESQELKNPKFAIDFNTVKAAASYVVRNKSVDLLGFPLGHDYKDSNGNSSQPNLIPEVINPMTGEKNDPMATLLGNLSKINKDWWKTRTHENNRGQFLREQSVQRDRIVHNIAGRVLVRCPQDPCVNPPCCIPEFPEVPPRVCPPICCGNPIPCKELPPGQSITQAVKAPEGAFVLPTP